MKRIGLKSIHSEPKTAFKLPLKRESKALVSLLAALKLRARIALVTFWRWGPMLGGHYPSLASDATAWQISAVSYCPKARALLDVSRHATLPLSCDRSRRSILCFW